MAVVRRKKHGIAGPPHLAGRVALVRKRVRSWRSGALLVSNPQDIRYLTGFVGDDSWAVVWAVRSIPTVITDFRFKEQIQQEAPHVTVQIRKTGLKDVLIRLLNTL